MRMSLLMQREPFSQIVENTLPTLLACRSGAEHEVRWHDGRPRGAGCNGSGKQVWLSNIYLNAIYPIGSDPAILEPIRNEFSRSLIWWRRPLQRTYVSLATSRFAPWFAHAHLDISPPVPDAQGLLVIPGNHKIRLLDRAHRLVYGALKDGFVPLFLARELTARQRAADHALPVPPLQEIGGDGTWFSEHYVSGTPMNRLAGEQQARQAMRTAFADLARLHQATAETVMTRDYAGRLLALLEDLIARHALLTDDAKLRISDLVHRLIHVVDQSSSQNDPLGVAMTHGDFQPANILVDEDRIWLIDWEYADRRQIGYDGLVFGLRSRSPVGLATRIAAFVNSGKLDRVPIEWLGIDGDDRSSRRTSAALFGLEELVLHLAENEQPLIMQPGPGLSTLTVEIGRWLETDGGS